MSAVVATFRAPWGRKLRGNTWVTVALLLMATGILLVVPMDFAAWRLLAVLPALALIAGIFCRVKGYVLREDSIEILRPGKSTVLPLQGLESVAGDVEALKGALRLLANTRLCSITGWFWSRRLGRMRAYMTDTERTVVLRYRDATVLISPHDPQQFLLRVRKLLGR